MNAKSPAIRKDAGLLRGVRAAQRFRVGKIQTHDFDHLRITRDARPALHCRFPQLSLDQLGITLSCTFRQASVNSFAADHDTDVQPACFI